MKIILEATLPDILFPAIERHVTCNEMEFLADLYGRRDNNEAIVNKVFPYGTMYANNAAVLVPEREEISDITYNMANIVNGQRLGDLHSHVAGEGIMTAQQAATKEQFIEDFLKGVHYSRADRKGMKKKYIYLILGFGHRPAFFDKEEIITCPDGKSVFGVLPDYVYCISGWSCKGRFGKDKIIVC